MNRNIKFRAWDDINKKWLMGYEEIGGFSLVGEAVACGEWDSVLARFVLRGDFDKSEGLIIQQFTGLRDKNEKEIYEGDIVKYVGDDDLKYSLPAEVSIGEYYTHGKEFRHFGVRVKRIDMDLYFGLGGDYENYKIIGNILKNPELLKQNEELEGDNDENGICDVCKRPYNTPGGGPCMGCGRGTSIATGLLLLDNPQS